MVKQTFYELWHMRYDEEGQDHDKLLGIYSTQEGAEQALALLRDKPGFRDYPDGFELGEGPLDETCFTDGFVTVWGDEEPDYEAQARPPVRLILEGHKDDGTAADTARRYYTLWLRYIDEDGYDHELTPGTYTSRENAKQALAFLSDKSGFRDHPDCFEISEGVVDETYFVNGFVAVQGRGSRDVEAGPTPETGQG
jgi:hypothetical protein